MTTRRTLLASAALAPLAGASGWAAGLAVAQESEALTVTVERDIAYGEIDGETLVLDVYRPTEREAPRPAVIVIHGGGWSEGLDRSLSAGAAKLLAESGYVAFNVEYRLMPIDGGRNTWPAQLDDLQRAVRWVRANAGTYGVDPDRLASYGYSSGGHLAAMLGVRDTRDNSDPALAAYSSRVSCAVVLAGDADLALPYPSDSDDGELAISLGGTSAEVPEAYEEASPIAWVDAETVPFLIVHSADDDVIPVVQGRLMAEALHEANVETVYVEFALGGHSGAGSWAQTSPWSLTFLSIHLRPDR